MSSFEKAGVLFITGLVAVILALALFGTSGSGSGTEPKAGDAAKDGSGSATPTDAAHASETGGIAGAPDRPVLRPEDELWPVAEQKTREKRGGGASSSAFGTAASQRDPQGGSPRTQPDSQIRQHTIAAGDRLTSIAKQYLGDATLWKSIADANPGLDPARLRPGTKIAIPDVPVVVADAGQPSAAPGPDSTVVALDRKPTDSRAPAKPVRKGTYIVKKGDTLSSIAAKELRSRESWRKLYTINKHVVKDANRLPVGLTLDLPLEN